LPRAWKFGDNVNTDEIIPATALVATDPDELAKSCMATLRPGFSQIVQPGDIIVAGANFGCGSSREHAPVSIRGAGIAAVVAKSFARIFFRNSINVGLPIVECPDAVEQISEGDEVRLDLENGTLENLTTGKSYSFERFGGEVGEIVRVGGLMNYVRELIRRDEGGTA